MIDTTFFKSGQVAVDHFQKFVNFSFDIGFVGGFDGTTLSNFCQKSGFEFGHLLVDLIDCLFAELFEVITTLVKSMIEFFLFDFGHACPFVLQITSAAVQFLFTVTTGFLIDLVFLVNLVEFEVTGVHDGRIVTVLVLHPLLQVHPAVHYPHKI